MDQNISTTLYPEGFSSFGMISMKLTQAGTAAPTAVILKNSINGDMVLARTAAGTYTLTITGAFPATKVIAPGGIIGVAAGSAFEITRTSDNVLTIKTGTIAGALADGLLNDTPIVIYVKR